MNSTSEVLAKIARPRSRHVFERTGLFDKLDGLLEASAVWVSAPPGAGKTTLLSSYLRKRGATCLWYLMDEGDRDPASFFWYLRLASKQFAPGAEDELPSYTSAYRGGLKTFALRFFEKLYLLLPPDFLIVLDDYHAVDGNDIDKVIGQAISALPSYGNIVVSSRESLPEECCRLVVNGRLALLESDSLRLTPNEVKGIAAKHQVKLSESQLDQLVVSLDGWAAGLIFQLPGLGRYEIVDDVDLNGYHETMFGYFANEVLGKQDSKTYELLVQLSLLPLITHKLARQLTGDESAGMLLNWLHRNNYFVDLQILEEPTYRFHNLFRSFLLDRLEQIRTGPELKLLRTKAGALLEESGHRSAALDLYESAGVWDKAAKIICADAVGKYRQGRFETLQEQIIRVPLELRNDYPWLEYWLGMSRVIISPRAAPPCFFSSFDSFRSAGDNRGALAAWSGAVYAMLIQWEDMKPINDWISVGEQLFDDLGEFPADAVGAQALSAMCSALSVCRPDNSRLPAYVNQTHALLLASDNTTFRLMGCNFLAIYYVWQGNVTKARLLINALNPESGDQGCSPAHRVMWAAARSWVELGAGDPQNSLAVISGAKQVTQRYGVHLFDHKFAGMEVQANLLLGRSDLARDALTRYMELLPGQANFLQFHAHFLSAWRNWLHGNVNAAVEALAIAAQFLELAGQPPILVAKVSIARAILAHEKGNELEAQSGLESARAVAEHVNSYWLRYHCYLVAADFALARDQKDLCLQLLQEAFSVGQSHGLLVTDWWNRNSMGKLCLFALQHDVEPEHTRQVIRKSQLEPPDGAGTSAVWPWRIRIELLGSFRLEIDGVPSTQHMRKHVRAMELLKCLAANHRPRLSIARLCDMLWPDADGDDARNSLKTTAHRLRKLLGAREALIIRDGFISLNPAWCWSDVRAFTTLVKVPKSSDAHVASLRAALRLYRGQLLEEEDSAPWMLTAREHLRKLEHDIIMEIGVRYESKFRWDKAIRIYKKGLSHDVLDEQVCRHLMICYRQSGRDAEALWAYELCKVQLQEQLARNPSSKTQKLAEAIVR